MTKKPNPDPLFTLRGDMEPIYSLLFQLKSNHEYIYASTQNGLIHKWNLQSCRENGRFKVSDQLCLVVKSIQNTIVCQTKGGEIKILDELEGSCYPKTIVNTDYWGFCKLDICNDLLVCPEPNSLVRVFSLDGRLTSKMCPSDKNNCGEVMCVKSFALLRVGYIFVLYESGIITLFQANGNNVTSYKITSECPMAMDFDGESKGVVGSSGDVIVGFELTRGFQVVKWQEATITNAGVSCVAIRPDKKLFCAGCWDGRLRLFSMKSFKLLAVLQSHKEAVQDVCYSPSTVEAWRCQWLLVAAGKDGRITLWDLYN